MVRQSYYFASPFTKVKEISEYFNPVSDETLQENISNREQFFAYFYPLVFKWVSKKMISAFKGEKKRQLEEEIVGEIYLFLEDTYNRIDFSLNISQITRFIYQRAMYHFGYNVLPHLLNSTYIPSYKIENHILSYQNTVSLSENNKDNYTKMFISYSSNPEEQFYRAIKDKNIKTIFLNSYKKLIIEVKAKHKKGTKIRETQIKKILTLIKEIENNFFDIRRIRGYFTMLKKYTPELYKQIIDELFLMSDLDLYCRF